jgi:hypothetical protein
MRNCISLLSVCLVGFGLASYAKGGKVLYLFGDGRSYLLFQLIDNMPKLTVNVIGIYSVMKLLI